MLNELAVEAVRSRKEQITDEDVESWKPHLSERPFSPDGAEFLVSIETGASFQSQLKPKNPRENPPVPH